MRNAIKTGLCGTLACLSIYGCTSRQPIGVEGVVFENGVEEARLVTKEGVVQCIAGFDKFEKNTDTIILGQPQKTNSPEVSVGMEKIQAGVRARVIMNGNGSFSVGPNMVSPVFQTPGKGRFTGAANALKNEADFAASLLDCKLTGGK